MLLAIFLAVSSHLYAAELCDQQVNLIDQQPGLKALDLTLKSFTVNAHVCVDQKSLADDFQASLAFNRLKQTEPHAFSSKDCFNYTKLFDKENPDVKILLNKVLGKDEILQLAFDEKNPQDIYLGNPKFKLTQPTSIYGADNVLRPVVGTFISKDYYGKQKDKELHAYVGATISIGTSTAAYLLIKDTDLSPEAKKKIISASGPIAGLVIGILKEVLYDKYRPQNHTVDKHDAIATGVGAGMIPFTIKIEF